MKRKQIRFISLCLAMVLIVALTLVMAACSSTPTLSSITVTPSPQLNLVVGSTQQFTATGTYSDGSTTDITSQVTWASSDTTIATISSAGLATGVMAGNTNVTAALSGVTSPAVILKVSAPTSTLSSIAVTPAASSASFTVGSTQQFTAIGTFHDGSTRDISAQATWASSDTTIATISSAGLATGVKAGNTNITAALSGVISPAVILKVSAPTPTSTTGS